MKLETRNWFFYWLPALAWAALAFIFSSGMFSAERTGYILRSFLEWLFGEIADPSFAIIHFLVRKTAHLIVYASLSLLWFRAQRGPRSGWRPSWALLALLVSVLVAVGDEFHQSFLPARTGTPWDVLLDTFGACVVQVAIAVSARRTPHSPV